MQVLGQLFNGVIDILQQNFGHGGKQLALQVEGHI